MRSGSRLRPFAALACLLALVEPAAAAGAPGFGQKRETIPALKDDIRFVECEMCELLSKHLHRSIKGMRDALPSWDHLTEAAIFDKLEVVCNPRKAGEGDWLSKLDIQEDGDRLRVIEMPGMADCQRECTTLARICSNLVSDHDIELAELLFKAPIRSDVTNALCHDLSGVCRRTPPPFVGPRPDGEAFVEMDEGELKLKNMMSDMQAQGMSGQVLDRNNIADQYADVLDDYDDDELEALGLGNFRKDEL